MSSSSPSSGSSSAPDKWRPNPGTKPQNWDKAKPRVATYLCPIGCGNLVPKADRIIHEMHCPAKYLVQLKVDKEVASTEVAIKPAQNGLAKGEDSEVWEEISLKNNGSSSTEPERSVNHFYNKLKKTKTVDIVGNFLKEVREKRSKP